MTVKGYERHLKITQLACQKAAHSVNKLSKTLQSISDLQTIAFEGNRVNVLGKIRSPCIHQLDLECLRTSNAKVIDLSEHVTNLTSICQLDHSRLAILDNYRSNISIFDLNLQNKTASIDINELENVRNSHLSFNSNLYSIQTNYCAYDHFPVPRRVFINTMERNEIIVLDHTLGCLNKIIKPFDIKTQRSIFEISLQNRNIFVLDNLNRRLRKFHEDGTFTWIDLKLEVEENPELVGYLDKLNKPLNNLISIPNLFAVADDVIALYMPIVNEIQIVDLKSGKSLSKILLEHDEKLSGLCFAYKDLVVYSKKSARLRVYRHLESNHARTSFEMAFERILANLIQLDYDNKITATTTTLSSSFAFGHKSIEFLDNRLFILFSESNLLVMLECH